MQKWEYKAVYLPSEDHHASIAAAPRVRAEVEVLANRLGADGWEAVGRVSLYDTLILFKRPLDV